MTETRAPRRKRNHTNPTPFRFSLSHDLPILRAIARYRLLRTSHIASLTNRSVKALNGRLRKLFDAGYLDIVDPTLERDHKSNPENLYALSDKGARIVADELGITMRRTRYTNINRRLGWLFVSHTLLVNDFLVRMERSCIDSNGLIRYLHQDDIILSLESRSKLKNPLKINTGERYKSSRQYSTVPDGLFGLEFLDKPKPNSTNEHFRAYFFLEGDRGSITQRKTRRVDREDASANYKKYEAYYHWFDTRGHERDYWTGFNFRVLFITTRTESRIRNLIDVVKPIYPKGRKQWLFTTVDMLDSTHNIFSAPWVDGKGNETTLVS